MVSKQWRKNRNASLEKCRNLSKKKGKKGSIWEREKERERDKERVDMFFSFLPS